MGILDDNPLEREGNPPDYWYGSDLLARIEKAIGQESLNRVVIDISYGQIVRVYTVTGKAGQVLRAIELEDLIKGVPLTELGLDKSEEKLP